MEMELKAYKGERGNWIPPKKVIQVPALKAASAALRTWICENELGGSNVGNIKIMEKGKVVALLSYNGRAWTTEKDWAKRKEIPLDSELAAPALKEAL